MNQFLPSTTKELDFLALVALALALALVALALVALALALVATKAKSSSTKVLEALLAMLGGVMSGLFGYSLVKLLLSYYYHTTIILLPTNGFTLGRYGLGCYGFVVDFSITDSNQVYLFEAANLRKAGTYGYDRLNQHSIRYLYYLFAKNNLLKFFFKQIPPSLDDIFDDKKLFDLHMKNSPIYPQTIVVNENENFSVNKSFCKRDDKLYSFIKNFSEVYEPLYGVNEPSFSCHKSPYFVIKPTMEAQSIGVNIVPESEIDSTVKKIRDHEYEDTFWKKNPNKKILIQECKPSKIIKVKDKLYRPTGRAVFAIDEDKKIHFLDSYWKLPKSQINIDSDYCNDNLVGAISIHSFLTKDISANMAKEDKDLFLSRAKDELENLILKNG